MKKTSPIVLALLFSMAGAVKIGQHQHSQESSFKLAGDYDQFVKPIPAIQPSPVKTSIKGTGCNADACPSTAPSCCMVSPNKNMYQPFLGKTLAQKKDSEKTEEV